LSGKDSVIALNDSDHETTRGNFRAGFRGACGRGRCAILREGRNIQTSCTFPWLTYSWTALLAMKRTEVPGPLPANRSRSCCTPHWEERVARLILVFPGDRGLRYSRLKNRAVFPCAIKRVLQGQTDGRSGAVGAVPCWSCAKAPVASKRVAPKTEHTRRNFDKNAVIPTNSREPGLCNSTIQGSVWKINAD